MSVKFKFIIAEAPQRFRFSGKLCLYNSPEFISLWHELENFTFLIVNPEKEGIAAHINFQIKENTAVSLSTAPFGSLSISEEVDFETLSKFIDFVEFHLKTKGIRKIIIKHYPGIYHPQSYEKVASVLALNGYNASTIDLNQVIQISNNSFDGIIHPMEKRNLIKSKKTGIIFTEHPNTEAEMVFNGIESFRRARKIPVNIDLKSIMRLVDKFPDKYSFFSASMENDMVAATICVEVKDSVLYNFLPAHNSAYNRFSPLVFLLEQIYKYASVNAMEYIDLGVSSINNDPQKGLIRFKERLGSLSFSKLTFLKEI